MANTPIKQNLNSIILDSNEGIPNQIITALSQESLNDSSAIKPSDFYEQQTSLNENLP
jgi:hypothetical protein